MTVRPLDRRENDARTELAPREALRRSVQRHENSRRRWLHSAILTIVMVVGFGVVLACAQANLNAAWWVDHTNKVRSAVSDMLLGITTAETAQRGYLLTTDAHHLVTYQSGRKLAEGKLLEMAQLTADNPVQQARINELRPLFVKKFDVLDAGLASTNSGHVSDAVALIREGLGRETMEQIRSLYSQIDQEEERLLAKRARSEKLFFFALLGVSLALVMAVGYYSWRSRHLTKVDRDHGLTESEAIAGALDMLDARELLIKETNHRVKNSLQVVSSLLWTQMAASHDKAARDALHDAAQRIGAVARVHEQLYRSSDLSSVPFEKYISELCSALTSSASGSLCSIEVESASVRIAMDQAVHLALIINELVTNALKHARRPDHPCTIRVHFSGNEREWRLEVSDNGPGLPQGFTPEDSTEGLGMSIVRSLAENYGAELTVSSGSHGATFAIVAGGNAA